jgi:hypothetical protein
VQSGSAAPIAARCTPPHALEVGEFQFAAILRRASKAASVQEPGPLLENGLAEASGHAVLPGGPRHLPVQRSGAWLAVPGVVLRVDEGLEVHHQVIPCLRPVAWW